MNIQEIQAAPIVGNAMSDEKLMDAIHEFVIDESNSMDDRCLALQKLDQVMGVETGLPTDDEVRDYVFVSLHPSSPFFQKG